MNATKNDLPLATREAMVKLLNEQLANAIDLFNQCKQAHWNVKGPSFIALHDLFDSVAQHVEDHSDELAERAVMLGGVAQGTTAQVAAASTLPAYPTTLTTGKAHVEALSTALAAFGAKIRQSIDSADKAGDKDTSDLFTGISREVDKDLWFVEAHLHD